MVINRKLLLIFLFSALLAVGCVGKTNPTATDEAAVKETTLPMENIKVNNLDLQVEVADTPEARTQGLSGRAELAEGKGMLFDFTGEINNKPGFWMKSMLISIDIIWIKDGIVLGIEPDVPTQPTNQNLPSYYPPSEITHVLEVPAGWAKKNNVTAGSKVTL